MPKDKLRGRLSTLFSDIENLAGQPDASDTDVQRQLNELRARLLELEADVKENQASTPLENHTALPILYEKEQVGYEFSEGELQPLHPEAVRELDAEKVIKAPLVETGKPVGAMIITPDTEHSFTPDDKRLAEAVAQQASLQIQNLRLLAAAERARAEAQAATRRFTHESWNSYLDAIHQNERIGFSYDQAEVEAYTDPISEDVDFQAVVNVMEEQIGRLILESDPEHPLTNEDKTLASAVANQVSQQVENLRLLADAARARASAEEAVRLLSKESWKNYAIDQEESTLGFIYNSNQVIPLGDDELPDITYTQPLAVQGQPIGQLAISGVENISEQDASFINDIAARVSIHLETLRLNDELRKRAAELQELDRLKSSFLANMSHELRTPLNSILGFSDVMLEGIDGPLTDYMDNDLKLIQKNGKHLLHLINDVLDMAKIESGRMNLHPEKFRLQDMFEEVVSITSTLASEKNLSLFVDSESDKEVEINADVTRVRQVMINLVNNSIKFTEKGKISIKAAYLGQDKVMITVKDTGIGIPPSHLETIFQEFAQVDTSTTRKVGGTGLGLPISRKLVIMHGGRLWAESTGVSGEGSTFYVELPLEAQVPDDVEKW
jgi:signal transduction histidine kinase